MSSLELLLKNLSDVAKDKQKKQILTRTIEELKKIPTMTNQPDLRFQGQEEILTNIFLSASEFVKQSVEKQQIASLKLIIHLLQYLQHKGNLTTEYLTFQYILRDMSIGREEVVQLVIELMNQLTRYPTIFKGELQRYAFLKVISLFTLYKLSYENHKNLELAFYSINRVILDNEDFLKHVIQYYKKCIDPHCRVYTVDSTGAEGISLLLIYNMVHYILSYVPDAISNSQFYEFVSTVILEQKVSDKPDELQTKFFILSKIDAHITERHCYLTDICTSLSQQKLRSNYVYAHALLGILYKIVINKQISVPDKLKYLSTLNSQILERNQPVQAQTEIDYGFLQLLLMFEFFLIVKLRENNQLVESEEILFIIKQLYQEFISQNIITAQSENNRQILKYIQNLSQYNDDVWKRNKESSFDFLTYKYIYQEYHVALFPSKTAIQQASVLIQKLFIFNEIATALHENKLIYLNADNLLYVYKMCELILLQMNPFDDCAAMVKNQLRCISDLVKILDQRVCGKGINLIQTHNIQKTQKQKTAQLEPKIIKDDVNKDESQNDKQSEPEKLEESQEKHGEEVQESEPKEDVDAQQQTQAEQEEKPQPKAEETGNETTQTTDNPVTNNEEDIVINNVNQCINKDQESVNDFHQQAKSLFLQMLKLMLKRNMNQPLTTPVPYKNHINVSRALQALIQTLPDLEIVSVEDTVDAMYSILTVTLSALNAKPDFKDIQEKVSKDVSKSVARVFNMMFNIQTNMLPEQQKLRRQIRFQNHFTYLQALRQILISQITPATYQDVFAQILTNEIVFIDLDVLQEVLDFCSCAEFAGLAQRMAAQSQLRHKIRRIIVECIKYQMIISHLDANPELQNYNEIKEHLKNAQVTAFAEYDYFAVVQSLFGQASPDAEQPADYFSEVINQILDFTDKQQLTLCNVEKITKYLDQLYKTYPKTFNELFVNVIGHLFRLHTEDNDFKLFTAEQQQTFFDIITEIITNYYDNQLQCAISEETLRNNLHAVYTHTDQIQILYDLMNFLHSQGCNMLAQNQAKLTNNYLDLFKYLLLSTEKSYLYKSNKLNQITVYHLFDKFFMKSSDAFAANYKARSSAVIQNTYKHYFELVTEITKYFMETEDLKEFVFNVTNRIISLYKQTYEDDALDDLAYIQASYLRQTLSQTLIVGNLIVADPDEQTSNFDQQMKTLSEQVGQAYAPFEHPQHMLFNIDLLKFYQTELVERQKTQDLFQSVEGLREAQSFLQAVFEHISAQRRFERPMFRCIAEIYNYIVVQYDSQNYVNQNDKQLLEQNGQDELTITPTINYAIQAAFRQYVSDLVKLTKSLEDDGTISLTEQDWEEFETKLFDLILTNMNQTKNSQTLRFYCAIIYNMGANQHINAAPKLHTLQILLQYIQDENVNEHIGSKYVTLAQLIISLATDILLSPDELGRDQTNAILELITQTVSQIALETPMDNLAIKIQYILAIIKLRQYNNNQYNIDIAQLLLPVVRQVLTEFLPNQDSMDSGRRVFVAAAVPSDSSVIQEFTDSAPEKLHIARSANYKTYGDMCYTVIVQILRELRQDVTASETTSQFMVQLYRTAIATYQRNHLNEENFLDFCNAFLDMEPQAVTRVFRDSCKLFEEANWLVDLRSRFLRVVADVAGFE